MQSDVTVAVIEKIENLVKQANAKENKVIDLNGHHFEASSMQRLFDDPRPERIEVSSLSAMAEYVKKSLEGVDLSRLFVHVVSPVEVRLLEAFSGDGKQRTEYVRATLKNDVDPYAFDNWYELESFIIALMSRFEATEDRDIILKVASSLVSESKIAKIDTGATAKLQVNCGVVNQSGIADKDVPYVANLRPFRTFRQVEQPCSGFVFRYRAVGDVVELKLIGADAGAWKHIAMKSIGDYFVTETPGLAVIA